MDILLTLVFPAIAFVLGVQFGRRASLIILAVCAVGAAALSVYARSSLAASGLHGWAYYTGENSWPVTLGIALILSCVAAVVQLVIRNSMIAFGVSFALVVLFYALVIPVMFVACAGYGACV